MMVLIKLFFLFLLVLNIQGEDLEDLINEAKVNDTKLLQEHTELLYQKKISAILKRDLLKELEELEEEFNLRFNVSKKAADFAYEEYRAMVKDVNNKIRDTIDAQQEKIPAKHSVSRKLVYPTPQITYTLWGYLERNCPAVAQWLSSARKTTNEALKEWLPESLMNTDFWEATAKQAMAWIESLTWWQSLLGLVCYLIPYTIKKRQVNIPDAVPPPTLSRPRRSVPPQDSNVHDEPIPFPQTEPLLDSTAPVSTVLAPTDVAHDFSVILQDEVELLHSNSALPSDGSIQPVPVIVETDYDLEQQQLSQRESTTQPPVDTKPFLQSSAGLEHSTDDLPEPQVIDEPFTPTESPVAPITPTSALPPIQPPFQSKLLLQELPRPSSASGYAPLSTTPIPTPIVNLNPTLNPSHDINPNTFTPTTARSPEVHAESLSMKKNSLRNLRNLEPEEPEPQPDIASPPTAARSRSTSIESEAMNNSRRVRATRGSSSPPPVKEAIYRKEFLHSPLDSDAAARPKREIEISDNFESELEAESQPGSDSELDDDIEY